MCRKVCTFVYGSNLKTVATQNIGYNINNAPIQSVKWEHRDPSNATYITTDYNGGYYPSESAELTPAGENVGLGNPFLQQNLNQSPGTGSFGYPNFGDPFGPPSCYIDWVLQPSCGTAFQMLSNGGGSIGPLDPIAAWRNEGNGWRPVFWEQNGSGQWGYWGYENRDHSRDPKDPNVIRVYTDLVWKPLGNAAQDRIFYVWFLPNHPTNRVIGNEETKANWNGQILKMLKEIWSSLKTDL